MSFREQLIILRDKSKLSQQELADKLDVSRQTVSRWEAGKSLPSLNQVGKICKVFGIDPSVLLGEEERGSDGAEARERAVAAEKKKTFAVAVSIGAATLAAVVGLIVTIVYAVKDAMCDASVSVWIIAVPQNTPMIILSVLLVVFIAILAVTLILMLRKRR